MGFNHYAKIKRILEDYDDNWYIVKINEPTSTKRFNGETQHYSHYYRIYHNGLPIKYCKFQRIELLAQHLKLDRLLLEFKMSADEI